MNSPAYKIKREPSLEQKRQTMNENFGNPKYIIESMAEFVRDGDVASITDLISAYISNSGKYKSQTEFAEAIGTSRQTLHRMFSHEAVSLNIFFGAIEQIYDDSGLGDDQDDEE